MMLRNLCQSAKTAFLKKRIRDAEKHKNDALTFGKKILNWPTRRDSCLISYYSSADLLV